MILDNKRRYVMIADDTWWYLMILNHKWRDLVLSIQDITYENKMRLKNNHKKNNSSHPKKKLLHRYTAASSLHRKKASLIQCIRLFERFTIAALPICYKFKGMLGGDKHFKYWLEHINYTDF